MTAFKLEDLREAAPDAAGVMVEEIYVRKMPADTTHYAYAVYRSARRVTIQFDDDPPQEDEQRTMLAPLAPLRGQIGALIEDWSTGSDPRQIAHARCFQSRVAFALETGLQNDTANATRLLEEIRDAILANRTAKARFKYLIAAAAVAGISFFGVWVAWLILGGKISATPVPAVHILNGLIGGTVGAFFSIATGLAGRTVLPDLHVRDNSGDALLRMVIGSIAGGILVCLIISGVVTVLGNGGKLAGDSALQLLVFGFLGGFSERMVPDLLGKVGASIGAKDAAVATAQAAVKVAPPPPAAPPPKKEAQQPAGKEVAKVEDAAGKPKAPG